MWTSKVGAWWLWTLEGRFVVLPWGDSSPKQMGNQSWGWKRVRTGGLVSWCLGKVLDVAMGREGFACRVNCELPSRSKGKINSLVSLLSASPLKHHHILSTRARKTAAFSTPPLPDEVNNNFECVCTALAFMVTCIIQIPQRTVELWGSKLP